MTAMFIDEQLIQNASSNSLRVWFEPWVEDTYIPPGQALLLKATASEAGRLEIERSDEIVVVFGWPTSNLTALLDGNVVWQSYFEVPSVPQGQSVSSFIKGIFWRHLGSPKD